MTEQCTNCGKRPGTEIWTGEGGTWAYIHGSYSKWCKLCCAREQLKYAKEQASMIPLLEDKVRELEEEDEKAKQVR